MARIGMKYPVYAKESAYTEGSAITYSAGEVLCHAIAATITYNRRNNPLYADDTKVENDKGLTDYSISFEGDRLPDAKRASILGETPVQDTSTPPAVTHYIVGDSNPPYVGFGFYQVYMEDNVTKYEAFWFHRVQFSLDNEQSNTKGEQIQWGTYTLTGTGFGVVLDSSNGTQFFHHMNFATEAACKTWLNAKAGIT